MAAVEIIQEQQFPQIDQAPSLQAAHGRFLLVAGLAILSWPGPAFGGTTGAGLSTDLANSSVLASGMEYVVQSGDSVSSIARMINPVDPSLARAALVNELGSAVVVPGEHVLIP